MNTVFGMIWTLVVFLIIEKGNCQDGFLNQDLLRLQQYSANEGQVDTLQSYSNFIQRASNGQAALAGTQYHTTDDSYNNDEYSRAGRSRKVYRIKNPFQQQEEERTQETNTSQDTSASNQYAALQYSLPPEEFLQQMRAESQYQQQQQQQFSTQISASPYTPTPQPQFQYSTLPAANYDNQQQTQISTMEPKSFTPGYQSNTNTYQYNNQNSYNLENAHSTPLPPYLSTSLPNNQFIGTPTNSYASSSSPIYTSSSQSSQQYVSSPFSNIHSGNLDYNNNRLTTVGTNSLNYENNHDLNKRMQIDHYDNAANGIRYPDLHTQYLREFPSSTVSPTSSPYGETGRNIWQSTLNTGYNVISKPDQSYSGHFSNFKYNQQDSTNNDVQRMGSTPSANNLFLNFVQPDYQLLSNLKEQARVSKTDAGQAEVYSHGDYGWKLSDKKSSLEPEISTATNFFKYQIHSVQPDTGAVSQMSFQMDSGKPYNYDQNTKPVTEKLEADEFSKAAAKAHENYKQQLEANKYLTNNFYNSNLMPNSYALNSLHNNEKQKNNLYNENSNTQSHTQNEIVTVSPFYYMNSKEVADTHKQPFDHDKALKNIVPIDVSNVVQNSDSQFKFHLDSNNRLNIAGFNKENNGQNLKPYSKTDPYYKDRDNLYLYNLKSKPDDSSINEKLRQFEQNLSYYTKSHSSEPLYNYGTNSGHKRFVYESPQSSTFANQMSNSHQDDIKSANIHQQGILRPQYTSDSNNILKFNDIPYRLTQNLHNNNFEQSNIPTPLPLQINQNVDNHNVDIAAEILAKLMANKQNMNRPEFDTHSSLISNINGFKVANPFNVDLKLVADMLKGKPAIDDSQMTAFRGEINKPYPLKLDISQLQQLLQLKNENSAPSSGLGAYLENYNSGRLPYQGIKYSRSEEDTENIPIADSSSNHPIGAVIEEDAVNEQDVSDLTEKYEESLSSNVDEDRPKSVISSSHKAFGDKHKHLSNSYLARHSFKRRYPKSDIDEPYPLLKPPPTRSSRYRGTHTKDKNNRRRRINKPKMVRVYKTEPLFESLDDDIMNPANVKRSLTLPDEKSDTVSDEGNT